VTQREWRAEVEKQLVLCEMTRKELASLIGRSYSYVNGVIAGQIRSKTTVEMISDELGIEPYSE